MGNLNQKALARGFNELGRIKHQGLNAEVTVVLKLNQGAPTNGLYIICGGLFLLLFWTSKKVKKES